MTVKQSFQPKTSPRFARELALAALIFIAGSMPLAAQQPVSDWSEGAKSRARLVSGGQGTDGIFQAGIEIELKGDAHTYWRNPGDAGVPPVISFEGSTNLAETSISFPAPTRYREGGADVYGYKDSIIFPVRVKPVDPSKPVALALHLQYAACENICIPAEARVALTLVQGPPNEAARMRIGAYQYQVPRPLTAQDAAGVKSALVDGNPKAPVWKIDMPDNITSFDDVFAEAPAGWFVSAKKTENGQFTLTILDRPGAAALPLKGVRVTLSGVRPLEFETTLDGTLRAP